MPDLTGWVILLGAALVGSTLGGIAGFGAGLIMLPLLAAFVGVKSAAPILTVTMLLGNLSRIWWSRHDMDQLVAVRFLAGAVPATAIGAIFYAGATSEWLRWIIGGFLIAALPIRRFMLSRQVPILLRHFPVIGACFGILSAIVVTIGPVLTPFFLAYGLRRGAFIATEAVCAFAMHVTRGVVFARYSLLTWQTAAVGVVLGSTMFAGSWVGRRLLDRMSDRVFLLIIEVVLVAAGLQFLFFSR